MYFQKGFGLKATVLPVLEGTYRSAAVERLKTLGYAATAGDLHLRLAREFGFCYGVDRAVEYAYETCHRFPGRRIFLAGEIIHNPDVNARLRAMGITILRDATDPAVRYAGVEADDVVILPAFGVTATEMTFLEAKGCVRVDTTCGSVLNVWKKVDRCARDGYTVIIHGKHYHEETRATASQALKYPGGHYLCVRDLADTAIVCDYLRGRTSARELQDRFAAASSPGFDPDRHLQRIGIANQTTMLMSETLEVQRMLREAMVDRDPDDFRAFDTICSATQDRQDAVEQMLAGGGLDLMLVIGGYNSSNTQALARMCAAEVPTYHVDRPACVDGTTLHHKPLGGEETTTPGWLPPGGVCLGVTAGASTPDSVVGEILERVLAARGLTTESLQPSSPS